MLGTCTVYARYCNFVDDILAIAKEQTRESINQSINPYFISDCVPLAFAVLLMGSPQTATSGSNG